MRAISSATMKQMLSASGLALATALVATGTSLKAQSFNALTPSVVGGSATIFDSTGTTTITVSTPSAVINWTPSDTAPTGGPINFQTVGTTATFQNDFNNPDFAVLNRIVPSGSTRPVQFNGNVISQLQQVSAAPVPGGTVFFYSPGGILIGGGSVFDVGNLVLTTSDLNYDAATGAFDTSGSYVFEAATVPGSQIVVSASAQLNATVDGSYIALVAPSVVNNGTIDVNGAAALVAADAATITFSPNGLFDIEVNSGTSATGTVAANNGTITGPAAVTAGNFFHRVYMVAVPKNDAITMAIGAGSSLGFDIAGAADASGNTIILSAGQDVVGGDPSLTPSAGGGTGVASITGADSMFTSAVTGRATGAINMVANTASGISFAGTATLRARAPNSSITANAGSVVNFAETLLFSARADGTSATPNAQGGGVALRALGGGSINVVGDATLSAEAFGAASTIANTVSGNGTGGSVLVEAVNGGTVSFQSDLDVFADGVGGEPTLAGIGGGIGTGGSVVIRASGTTGSAINVGDDLTISSRGEGTDGTGCANCLFDGERAVGGAISLFSLGNGNSVTVVSSTNLDVGADAGEALTGIAGDAAGGIITVRANDGAIMSFVDFTGTASAGGGGSTGTAAGNADGGLIEFSASGTGIGGIDVTGNMTLQADSFGGNALALGGAGGTAAGGSIIVSARDEKFIDVGGTFDATADATGGGGYAGPRTGIGGAVTIEARTAASLTIDGSASVVSQGTGGLGVDTQAGGLGSGGVAEIAAFGGVVSIAGDTTVISQGRGGDQIGNAAAGAGQGGTAQIVIGTSGLVELLQAATIVAQGVGGAGTSGPDVVGGTGTGGLARFNLGGGTLDIVGDLTLDSTGFGNVGSAQGGNGQGGSTSILQNGNTLTVGGVSYIGAAGSGGFSAFGSAAGDGTGGTISINASGSTAVLSQTGTATIEATGYGGVGRDGGAGTGGSIQVTATASTISAGSELKVFSEGQAGDGGPNGGNGGLGTGGAISLTSAGSALGASSITAPVVNISATGRGGDGTSEAAAGGVQAGDGGAGLGGTLSLTTAPDGGTIESLQLTASASGVGGLGGDGASSSGPGEHAGSGGSATGGEINFGSVLGAGTGTGGFVLGDVLVDAGASAGNGGIGGAGTPPGRGGSGGNATGGAITMLLDAGGSTLTVDGLLEVRANAVGGVTGPCFTACTVTAGTGTGGTIFLGSNGLTTGNEISATTLDLSAFGEGGNSGAASGAQGTGGSVLLRLGSGMTLTAGDVTLSAFAEGGDSFSDEVADLLGGAAQGGNAQFIASGTSSAVISGQVGISANAAGGFSSGAGGVGGNGTAGTARLYSDGGNIAISGSADLRANGTGGNGGTEGVAGAGGTGLGGSALLTVGTPTLLGNNGQIAVAGIVNASAGALGGAGFNAGSGTGGLTAIVARQGTLVLGQVIATADATGGNSINGGVGGAATGGAIEIFAHNAVEGGALLTADSLLAQATALGGDGGNIFNPNALGAVGGTAEGGEVSVFGSAGNGQIDIETLDLSADAIGGTGGTAVFDIGGTGGLSTGGAVQLGLASGIDTGTINNGSARFGTVEATASATGGEGGSAEFVGGTGGTAIGGGVTLLARGGLVTIDNASTFEADATGGAGGATITQGDGGNAVISNLAGETFISGVKLLVTNRFDQPTQRGSLNAAGLAFTAAAVGGSGTVNGTTSMAQSAVRLQITNGDYTGTDLSMIALADSVSAAAVPDQFTMLGGSMDLSGNLGILTPGQFSLRLDNATAVADSVAISAENWTLSGTDPAVLGTLTGVSSLSLTSGLDLVGHANLRSDVDVSLFADGRIAFGDVLSLGSITARSGGSIMLGGLSAQGFVDLFGGTDVETGLIAAIGSVSIGTPGSITTANVNAGSGTPGATDPNSIVLDAGSNVSTGNLTSSSDVLVIAGGDIGTGVIAGYDALILGHGNTALGGFDLVNRLLVADRALAFPGPGGELASKDEIFAATPVATLGAVSINDPSAAASLLIAAGTTADIADITATGDISIASGGNATLGMLQSSAGSIELTSSGGSIAAGDVTAAFGLSVSANGDLQLGAVSGSGVTLDSGAGLTAGNVVAGASGMTLTAGSNMQVGNLTSLADVVAVASGNLTAGSVQAVDALLLGGGSVTANSFTVSNRALIANASMVPSGGPIDKAQILAAAPVATGGAVTLANASNVGSLRIAAGTTAATAGVQASGNIGVTSTGSGSFGTLVSTGGNVELIARSGSVAASAINARLDVLASGAGGLNLGTVAGRNLALLSGGNVVVGTARAGVISNAAGQITGATGQLYIANASMLPVTAVPGAIGYTGLFAATPVAAGGTVSIQNAAIAGRILSSSNGAMTGGALTGYNRIDVISNAGVTVAQRWFAPAVQIFSGDITIVGNGAGLPQSLPTGIRTTQDGTVGIASISASPALIGDGLSGSGFALSNAEIALISTGRLTIAATDIPANAVDMQIGLLDLTVGSSIGSGTVVGSAGRLIFATGNASTQALSGAIRVTGAINGTGFGSGNVLEFSTGRFELDATTGSISLASTGTTLGGIAEFNAANIHVASATILDRLAANPLYTGRIADLNAPAAVQRPDGVLRALGLDFYPTGTLYIQNTGTALNPAGFFADIEFTDVTAPANAQAGSVSVVVNGAFQTPTGIVAGVDAHALAVAEADDLAPFSADSQINGCLFSVAECIAPVAVDEGEPDVIGAISAQFEVGANDPLGSTPAFTEEPADETGEPDEEDAQVQLPVEDVGQASPIVPPMSIINDGPLDTQSEIEEPVTGGGNPALIGSMAIGTGRTGDAQ